MGQGFQKNCLNLLTGAPILDKNGGEGGFTASTLTTEDVPPRRGLMSCRFGSPPWATSQHLGAPVVGHSLRALETMGYTFRFLDTRRQSTSRAQAHETGHRTEHLCDGESIRFRHHSRFCGSHSGASPTDTESPSEESTTTCHGRREDEATGIGDSDVTAR